MTSPTCERQAVAPYHAPKARGTFHGYLALQVSGHQHPPCARLSHRRLIGVCFFCSGTPCTNSAPRGSDTTGVGRLRISIENELKSPVLLRYTGHQQHTYHCPLRLWSRPNPRGTKRRAQPVSDKQFAETGRGTRGIRSVSKELPESANQRTTRVGESVSWLNVFADTVATYGPRPAGTAWSNRSRKSC